MKIQDLSQQMQVQQVSAVRVDKHAAESQAVTKGKSADRVEITGFSSVNPLRQQGQDFRAQRVDELKAVMANGGYQVPARAVAEAMLAKVKLGH